MGSKYPRHISFSFANKIAAVLQAMKERGGDRRGCFPREGSHVTVAITFPREASEKPYQQVPAMPNGAAAVDLERSNSNSAHAATNFACDPLPATSAAFCTAQAGPSGLPEGPPPPHALSPISSLTWPGNFNLQTPVRSFC